MKKKTINSKQIKKLNVLKETKKKSESSKKNISNFQNPMFDESLDSVLLEQQEMLDAIHEEEREMFEALESEEIEMQDALAEEEAIMRENLAMIDDDFYDDEK